MQNKISPYKSQRQVFLLFLISSIFAGLLTQSFHPEHTVAALLYTTTPQQSKHSATPIASGKVQPTNTPAPTPSLSPTPAYSSGIVVQDNFDRPDQTNWDDSSHSYFWQESSSTDNTFSIHNHRGLIAGQGLQYATSQPSIQDMEVDITGSISSFQEATLGGIVRWVNSSSWYEASINGNQFSLIKRAPEGITTLASMPFSARAGATYEIQCMVFHQQLVARVWFAGSTRPAQWQLMTTDNSLQSGYGGVVALTQPGSTATINSVSVLALYATN